MSYVPPELKERIKREVSVQRLAEARGIKLRRSGKELIGLCPFHKDTHPSLNIDPAKNVWNCKGACGEGGDVILWVMRAEGVSFTHAVELLKRDYLPSAASTAEPPPKISTVPKLPPLFEATADDQKLLQVVVNYYHETLKQTPGAQQYLLKRGLQSAEMVEHFRLGFSNRSLNYHLADWNRVAGAEQRGRLKRLGVLRNQTPGHEHFVGSLVIPILNLNGEVVQMYGRKINDNLRTGTDYHLYLPGPRCGVWNEAALIASKEIILCEALIDALTFWCAGYRNVTTSYGVNGFNDYHREAFQKHGTKKIYIAYDRDEAGDRAAAKHAEELIGMGIECFRVLFPKGMDTNEYALKVTPAAKALGLLLNKAEWLGKGTRTTTSGIEIEPTPAATEEVLLDETQSEEAPHVEETAAPQPEMTSEPPSTAPAAEEQTQVEEKPEPTAKEENAILLPASPPAQEGVFSLAVESCSVSSQPAPVALPPSVQGSPILELPTVMKPNGVIEITLRDRLYTVRSLAKNTSHDAMRVTLTVSATNLRGEVGEHTDTLDFYTAQRRAAFSKQAAQELGVREDLIHQELGRVRLKLETLRDEQIEKALQPEQVEAVEMTAAEKSAALELLRDPRLIDRILADFERCGVVGEETNKKVSYLAAVSRLLEAPLAVVMQSSSAAGKSSLMEAMLDFVPEEQRESYTAMTGQSLFYMGEKNLKHKILAIAEQQGAERAAYPLKLLQSEGRIKIASTGKDPNSGRLVTRDYEVEGPVMIFLTTTAYDVDEELLNRCIVLTVNEEPAQTQAIHRKQREAQTLEGLLARQERAEILKLHRNAQRLLRPIAVVNEHAPQLSFPDHLTRTRRDHMKFLTLIRAIALLHQYQREIKNTSRRNTTLEYIEATKEDNQLAEKLIGEVLLRSLDELPPQTQRLLVLLDEMVARASEERQIERKDYRFSRREVREYLGCGDTQLRKHLHRLEELEYLAVHRGGRGQGFVYELVLGLLDVEKLKQNLAGVCGNFAGVPGQFASLTPPQNRRVAGGSPSSESPAMTRGNGDFYGNPENRTTRVGGEEEHTVIVQPASVKPNGGLHAAAGQRVSA
jgi:DNA primase catalytic core